MDNREKTTLIYVILFLVVIFSTFMAAVWIHNFDNFCANPEGPGNWMVQPYCNK